ncbi:F-box protein At1g11270-like [Raphanus sativus]|uniref:F-box protein At1g11270-like n=1 Tax=Raphanus sativus TaxID=3726 RepID=A0A9W3DSQ9_RAPSA|nr:F-box protein At1g11270-like [Raphanus sativus]
MLKRHRASVELLPHDVVELILERLPVDSLLRFKSVSKNWKSTIDSGRFQQGQFIRRKQSRGPDVLCLPFSNDGLEDEDNTYAKRFVSGSSVASTLKFPVSRKLFCYGSCDGLLCLYSLCEQSASVVVNPATRWHRTFPLSNVQHLSIEKFNICEYNAYTLPRLGFGKDKVTGTYKPVFLYNSYEFKPDSVTTCEVFDFSTNAWRYLVHASPYRILGYYDPVYLDGSLYYLTNEETKVPPFIFPAETFEVKLLSLDLHTETFQVICKTPTHYSSNNPYTITMCILHDRLCVSEINWPIQEIWLLDGANKTWMII